MTMENLCPHGCSDGWILEEQQVMQKRIDRDTGVVEMVPATLTVPNGRYIEGTGWSVQNEAGEERIISNRNAIPEEFMKVIPYVTDFATRCPHATYRPDPTAALVTHSGDTDTDDPQSKQGTWWSK